MNRVKLAIIGSRDFTNYGKLCEAINRYFPPSIQEFNDVGFGHDETIWPIEEIISGAARGADLLGAKFAKENNIKLTEFPALWDVYGKSAGFRRNEDIIKASNCVLCFWDGASKGSANSLSIAKRLKIETVIIYF